MYNLKRMYKHKYRTLPVLHCGLLPKYWIQSKIIIYVWHCSLWNINEYHFRLGLTNLYSIDEYKNQSLLFYLKYFVLYELMHNPTPSLQRSEFCFRHLNKTYIKQLQSVDILHFLKQFCSYIIKFLRSKHLLKMSMWHWWCHNQGSDQIPCTFRCWY